MALPTWYGTGTASVANGSAMVSGTNTLWGGDAVMTGDLFCVPSQPLVPPQRIKAVTSDGALELWAPWPGTSITGQAYEIRYVGIIERSTAKTREVLEKLGEVSPYYDVQVDVLADRDAYNDHAASFRVLVSNVGDGRAAIYSKNSPASGDWSAPAYVTGPTGAASTVPGVVWRGAYAAGTTYAINDGVTFNGSSFRKLTTAAAGTAPSSATPPVNTAAWEVLAAKGSNGTITGVTSFWSDRILNDTTGAAARAGLGVEEFPATRTALKALDTAKVTSAYLTETGREGQFIWSNGNYSAQIGADTQEGIYIRATNVAATAGAWVRVLDGDINPRWFGLYPSNAGSANQAALTAAIFAANGRWVTCPPGTYSFAGPVTVDGVAVRLRAYGADTTDFVFSGTGSGFVLGASTPVTKVEIDNIGILKSADAPASTAIAATFAPTDSEQDAKITRCRISGTLFTSTGWGSGIHLINATMPVIEGNMVVGRNGNAATVVAKTVAGIYLVASQLAILPTVKGNHVLYFKRGVYVNSTGAVGIEGLRIDSNDLIHCDEGVVVQAAGTYRAVQNLIQNNHCEFFSKGIVVQRLNDVWMQNNDLIADAASTSASWGVDALLCNQVFVTANTIEDGAGTGNALLSGVKLDGCTYSNVRDNIGRTPDALVAFVNASQHCTEANNKQKGAGARFVDISSTSSNHSVPKSYGGSISDAGTALVLPRNWSSSRISAGLYRVTHNMGIDTGKYAVFGSMVQPATNNHFARVAKDVNSFDVVICQLGTATTADGAFDFHVVMLS